MIILSHLRSNQSKSLSQSAITTIRQTSAALISVDLSSCPIRLDLAHSQRINFVPRHGSGRSQNISHGISSSPLYHSGGRRSPRRTEDDSVPNLVFLRAIEHSVQAGISIVSSSVCCLIRIHLVVTIRGLGCTRAGNEVVVDDIMGELPTCVCRCVCCLIIVDDIVDVLRVVLG